VNKERVNAVALLALIIDLCYFFECAFAAALCDEKQQFKIELS